jgi:hypothetical protein
VFGMLFLRGATHDQDKRAADNSSKARCSHAGPHPQCVHEGRSRDQRVAEPQVAADCQS